MKIQYRMGAIWLGGSSLNSGLHTGVALFKTLKEMSNLLSLVLDLE